MNINNEPKFWEDIIGHIPCIAAVTENWTTILAELEEQIESTNSKWLWNVPRVNIGDGFKSKSTANNTKLYTGSSWKLMGTGVEVDVGGLTGPDADVSRRLVEMKTKMPYHDALTTLQGTLPKTVSIIKEYSDGGDMLNTALSVLSPGTVINPHQGDASFMRVHIGLKCDPECRISVGNDDTGYESRVWSPGKAIAFKDGGNFYHSVNHDGVSERWIFLFDIPLKRLRNLVQHELL
jgi:hypothetical protein